MACVEMRFGRGASSVISAPPITECGPDGTRDRNAGNPRLRFRNEIHRRSGARSTHSRVDTRASFARSLRQRTRRRRVPDHQSLSRDAELRCVPATGIVWPIQVPDPALWVRRRGLSRTQNADLNAAHEAPDSHRARRSRDLDGRCVHDALGRILVSTADRRPRPAPGLPGDVPPHGARGSRRTWAVSGDAGRPALGATGRGSRIRQRFRARRCSNAGSFSN